MGRDKRRERGTSPSEMASPSLRIFHSALFAARGGVGRRGAPVYLDSPIWQTRSLSFSKIWVFEMLKPHANLRIPGRIFYSQKGGGRQERRVMVADAKIAKELIADTDKMVLYPHLTDCINWMVLESQDLQKRCQPIV